MTIGQRDIGAVEAFLVDLITAGVDGPLPMLGSAEWSAADESTQLAALAAWALGGIRELDPRVIEVRCAAELAAHALRMKAAAVDVHSAADWADQARRHEAQQRALRARAQPYGAAV
ncbi:hypothetical protein ACTXG6_06000 [Pseudonocardia sp. Cha107L01]|uniref:hypothetical protein n=1 Tax=Pseudonocardia sp. Cha107L01 TaxID=3457576 RepID=UPI00403E63EF